jgi:type IV secretion system protein VirB8
MNTEPELEAYWAEAASWDADRVRMAARSSRRAWWVAAAGWSCAIMGLGALIFLMPLKRVEAFVVRVDNSTGIVDVVPTYTREADPAEVVSRYLLTHYVTVCERFNFATAESDYEECGAFHNAQRNAAWYALWNPTNPASPLNIYKDGTTVRSRVTSVSFFRRGNGLSDLAQVRYVKALRRAGATQEEMTHWIASVQYAYTEPSKDAKTRGLNPLGFKILDFHPEPEIIQEAAVPSPAGPEPASRRIQP